MRERSNKQPNLNESSKTSFSKKVKKFLENSEKAVTHVLAKIGIASTIAGGTVAPAATSFIPETVASINIMATTTGVAVKTITLGTAAALAAACEHPDITPPTVEIVNREINISGGETLRISGNQVYIGNTLIFRCSDDVSTNLNITLTFNGKSISSGYVFNEGGTISVKARDEAGNLSHAASSTVNMLNNAPTIDLKQSEVDVSKPRVVSIDSNKLTIGGDVIATWSDDKTQNCKVSLTLDGKEVKSGDTLDKEGTLILAVTDEDGKSSSVNIKLNVVNNAPEITLKQSQISIYGETQVTISSDKLLLGGEEIASRTDDRTDNCTVSIKFNGKEIKSGDIINATGTLSITVTDGEGKSSTKEISITKEVIEYQGVSINNIKPVDILPIIGQVENGDPHAYEHIEHLRIAEATRIRDMMWKYGASNHSPEQYQQLMNRLNTGMTYEIPLGYDNYEILGVQEGFRDPSNHAHVERNILNSIVKHANFKLILGNSEKRDERDSRQNTTIDYIKTHPNTINIFGNSSYTDVDTNADYKQYILKDNIIELCNSKQFIIFAAGTNIKNKGGIIKNKIYNGKYEADKHGVYCLASMANSDKNNYPNSHILVTISTNKDGDFDQTNDMTIGTSKYPIGFAKNVLFAGRIFPFHSQNTGLITATDGNYATSEPNYLNVAIMDLCFQMFAEVKDVDELLEMVRSTCDTDYIRLDGETQELQLMNPAKFFKKYLMPKDIPSSISAGETIPLEKGYYKGVVFAMPGAEVKINGQWVEYCKANESLIKSQNPFNLNEWRLNGDLVRKYNKNGTVTGKAIAVDDQWNGLNLDQEGITINIQNNVQRSMIDVPSYIRSGETIMLTNGTNEGVIFDIPGAQPYIKGKSWVEYNDENKALVQAQDLKTLQWRLNGDLAMKDSKEGYIKGRILTVNNEGDTINEREVTINVEDNINNSYIAQGYNKNEGEYVKNEGNYNRSEKGYIKNEGNYNRSERGYIKSEGNHNKMGGIA